jgi:TPR repeat protein
VSLNIHEKTINRIIGGAKVMNKAPNALGLIYTKDQTHRLDKNKELKWYKPIEYRERINKYNLAKTNSVEAMQYLIRLSIDADKGIVEAQYILATMYADGLGVSQDDKLASEMFYRIAKAKADKDNAMFVDNLKHKNIPQELKFLTINAESGIADAQFKLGMEYTEGRHFQNTNENNQKAFKWYLLAAEQGNSKAQYTLGKMYVKGVGVKASQKEAIKWFRYYLGQTTIKLGQTNIQEQQIIYSLAKKNVEAALKILTDDARIGIATAQYYLGDLYRDGIGVSRSNMWAYMWYYLSALQGIEKSSDQMSLLEKIMSSKEIQQAKYFAGTCMGGLDCYKAIN